MKKILILLLLTMGIYPCLHKGKLKLSSVQSAYAQDMDDEWPDIPGGGGGGDGDGDGTTEDLDSQTVTVNGNITTTETCYNVYFNGVFQYLSCGTTECGISAVGFGTYPQTGTLGDNVVLSANPTAVGIVFPQFQFQQSSDGGTTWSNIGNDPSSPTFEYTIDEPGVNTFRVIVTCSCSPDPVTSNVDYFTASNPCDPADPAYDPSKCGSCGAADNTVAIYQSPGNIADLGGDYGITKPIGFYYDFGACSDGHNWTLVVKGIHGGYEQFTRILPNQQDVEDASTATSSNFCVQAYDLSILGYSSPSAPVPYYCLTAVNAHENVHYQHLQPALVNAQATCESYGVAVSVPVTGLLTESDAITAIGNSTGYANACASSRLAWFYAYQSLAANDHNPGGATDTAEHAVVDPIIAAICQKSKNNGWTGCSICP